MQIDPNEALSLAAVIRKDVDAVRRLSAHGKVLAEKQDSIDRARAESLGYTLHNIYNALENCFTQISLTFENHVKDRERWHRELLEKMFLDLSPLRPAVLNQESRTILSELLAFRHVFRHSYELELNSSKLLDLWHDLKANSSFLGDLETFARTLEESGTATAD